MESEESAWGRPLAQLLTQAHGHHVVCTTHGCPLTHRQLAVSTQNLPPHLTSPAANTNTNTNANTTPKPHAQNPEKVYEATLKPRAASSPFCKYDDPVISLFVSVLFLAGIGGAFLGSWTNKWRGRRPTMILGGACFLAGAVVMAAAVHVSMLVIGRVLLGIGVGLSVQCGPLFLSELAPARLRGMFNVQFQLFITIGILLGQVINYLTQHHPFGWRLSLGLAGAPALLLVAGCMLVPETPNSLVERGHTEEARRVLVKIRGTEGELTRALFWGM